MLDTALRIAVDEGLAAVSIASVASAMGVTRPVVYSCFDTRFDLMNALMDRESGRLLGATLEALHSARGEDPDQVFVDGYHALFRAVVAHPEAWRIVFEGNPDPELATTVSDVRKVVSGASTRWIAPALKHWWGTEDLERKTPALIEMFMSSCEAAVRVMLDSSNDLTADDLAPLSGRLMAAAYRAASHNRH